MLWNLGNGFMSVHVLAFARTPFGRYGGALRDVPVVSLGERAVRAALARASVDGSAVDELALGVNFPGGDRSIARQVSLRAGIPDDRVSYTVDRACCSSLAATTLVCRSLTLGESAIGVAGGAENLSRVPFVLPDLRWGHRLGPVTLPDPLVISCPYTGVPRAVQAAEEAAVYGVGREEQDAWALRSQQRCAAAVADGFFASEVVAGEELQRDEVPRPDTTLERLAALKTVYGSATVTPGNAPDLSSGATALVLASHEGVERAGVAPLAVLEGWAMASGDPQHIASMPAVAARRALARAGVALEDVDVLEINEAFAAVPLVSTRVLADGDAGLEERLRARTNVNGGAIALGHPTGATAARLIMTCIAELRRRGGGIGLVTLCGGVGEAEAVIVRVMTEGAQ
jgi:acetyl-CoA C-acetyltransferase